MSRPEHDIRDWTDEMLLHVAPEVREIEGDRGQHLWVWKSPKSLTYHWRAYVSGAFRISVVHAQGWYEGFGV